ncbi:biliverdin-producing heme oxygenase [Micromonospora sp. U56]|uniref:biliverdin-producing heme oxygenase n=1 Tax=Micromonospora sp. U56 TaxID=2824900 RepID=UPI001B36592A|nr:biliverdin-producing heme oxygenase [Micromonospora sp. U56]MBQ0892993.1 biliverdin-producing heme oxygenase [Micromonospora sp. U56]
MSDQPVPDLLAALRTGTRRPHREVERVLGLPGRIRSRADLAAMLAAMLAGWQPVEEALAAVDWVPLGLDARLGTATDLLRADLGALATAGAPAGDPAPAPEVRFDTLARAVGGRYVLLGSAMGGRIVAPVIERRLGPGWTRFLRRDGMDPDRDWATFRTAVTGYPWDGEQREQAVESARSTFALIGATAARSLDVPPR